MLKELASSAALRQHLPTTSASFKDIAPLYQDNVVAITEVVSKLSVKL
ncbi:MAG: hypothetical protein L0G25_06190 [Psychrobacter sp.]|nr:hypothetical protein [Psychrobacter sp.]